MHRDSLLIGTVIIAASIALLFWWGIQFEIFGHRFVFDLPTLGFFVWPVSGMFGVGYAAGGWRPGLKTAGGFLVVLAAALAVGIVRGNYR